MDSDGPPEQRALPKGPVTVLILIIALGTLGFVLWKRTKDPVPPPQGTPGTTRDAGSRARSIRAMRSKEALRQLDLRMAKLEGVVLALGERLEGLVEKRKALQRSVSETIKERGTEAAGIQQRVAEIQIAMRTESRIQAKLEDLNRSFDRLGIRAHKARSGAAAVELTPDSFLSEVDLLLDLRLDAEGHDRGDEPAALAEALYEGAERQK